MTENNQTDSNKRIQNGDSVSVDYIGELEDGTVFDTSLQEIAVKAGIYNEKRDYSPLSFTVGAGQMIKGFDKGVVGMAVGEEKKLRIPPEEAYGTYQEKLVQKIPLEEWNLDFKPEVGQKLMTGIGQVVKVTEVNEDHVTLDFNHSLAGKTLIFKVKAVSIGSKAKNTNKGFSGSEKAAEEGDIVSVDYIGELEDGTVFDTSMKEVALAQGMDGEGRQYEPLCFTLGAGEVIKGFENSILGMRPGDEKTVKILPEEAYGEYMEELVRTVPVSALDFTPAVGQVLATENGLSGTVTGVDKANITVDFNHKLAGKVLIFKLKLISVESK